MFAPGAVNAEVGTQGAFGVWAEGAVSESEPLVERIHRGRVENQGQPADLVVSVFLTPGSPWNLVLAGSHGSSYSLFRDEPRLMRSINIVIERISVSRNDLSHCFYLSFYFCTWLINFYPEKKYSGAEWTPPDR